MFYAYKVTYKNNATDEVVINTVCSETFDGAVSLAKEVEWLDEEWDVISVVPLEGPEADLIVKRKMLLSLIPDEPTGNFGIWQDGCEILSNKEKLVESIADLLEAMGFEEVNTGYYDPIEDFRNDEIDEKTGFYYVSF